MKNIKVRAHTAYLGSSGYSSHARGFFREMSNYVDLRVRNFNWDSSDNIKKYITSEDLDILDQITLSVGDGRKDFPISQIGEFQSFDWKNKSDRFDQDVDIVLIEPSHFYFYEEYKAKIKIAYTVWESTQVSDQFLSILSKFDAIWVVSSWHKDCLVNQGVESSKIYVVPEGVDSDFNVDNSHVPIGEYDDHRFKFLFFGRWDYRKSVPEIVKSFIDEFVPNEEVDLVLSADNPFSVDGMSSTEERLRHYGLDDDRIKVKHFPSRQDYVNYLHNGNVMITCARSEGWNIPLCEAIAAGIPVTYSNWGAQLEFCGGIGNPINIISEVPASGGIGSTFRNGYDFPGNYCLPDYGHLRETLRYIYQNYSSEKEKAIVYSQDIRNRFSWSKIGQIGFEALKSTIENCHKIGVVFSSQNEFRKILEKFNGDTLLITNSDVEYDLSNFVVYSNKIENIDMLDLGINTARNLGYSKICLDISDQQFEFDLNLINQDIIELYHSKKKEAERIDFSVSFIDGPRVEILGRNHGKYSVEFIDSSTNKVIYESTISNNCWCSSNYQYFINWLIRITDAYTGEVVYTHQFDLKHKKALICLESSSLGDCIAWIPGVDEFRKKHDCQVVLSTFRNDLFESEYPEIEFVAPGSVVNGIYALYRVGWYYINGGSIDTNRNPVDPKTRPMQATSFDILGIDYRQIRSKVKIGDSVSRFEDPYVCIGIHATAQAKYWNNPTGWQDLIDWFNSAGYKVVMISREGGEYMGNRTLTGVIDKTGDLTIEDRIIDLKYSKMFIGIGSGLSWLAWAVGVPVTLISGFSSPDTEFLGDDVIRIFNPDSCNSCFNRHMLDAGDWMWCPDYKNTERQFECTKSISSDMVISRIKEFLDKL